jgi:hypothetical protein
MTYISEIIDDGDIPKFIVTPEGAPEYKQVASTATAAWTPILQRVNDLKSESDPSKKRTVAVSGTILSLSLSRSQHRSSLPSPLSSVSVSSPVCDLSS